LCHQPLERRHVDVDGSGIESQVRAIQPQTVGDRDGQRLAEGEEGLTQIGAGLSLAHVPPEEGGELVSRVGETRR